MGELVGIVPRKLDVSTLLNIVRKYADIKDEEALKRAVSYTHLTLPTT